MSLVDTPGFGLFDSHVENLAKEALKSSSVCVYITTYDALHSESNGKYLKFIPNHDQGTHICMLMLCLASVIMHDMRLEWKDKYIKF